MLHATTDPLLSAGKPGLVLAADSPLDLDRVGTGEAHSVQDLANVYEVDASSVSDRRKVPLLESASVILHVDISHQVLDPFELVTRVDALIIIGDVSCIEIETDVGWSTSLIKDSIASAF